MSDIQSNIIKHLNEVKWGVRVDNLFHSNAVCKMLEFYNSLSPKEIKKTFNFSDNTPIIISGGGFLAVNFIKKLIESAAKNPVILITQSEENFKKRWDFYSLGNKVENLHIIQDKLDNFDVICDKVKKALTYLDCQAHGGLFFHTASSLNSLYTLKQIYPTSVLPALICSTLARKLEFCFINSSSFSIFASSSYSYHAPLISDDIYLHHTCSQSPYKRDYEKEVLIGGYAQAKAIIEYIVPQIHLRMGLLCPDMGQGFFNKEDFLPSFIKIVKTIGTYPAGFEDVSVDITPVSDAANKVIEVLNKKQINLPSQSVIACGSYRGVFLSELVELLSLKEVDSDTFLNSLEKSDCTRVNKIMIKNAFFRSHHAQEKNIKMYNIDLFQATRHTWVRQEQKAVDRLLIKDYIKRSF